MDQDYAALTFDHLPQAVVLTTDAGRILHWNPAATRIFGYEVDEARGRTLRELIVPEDLQDDEDQARRDAIAHEHARIETLRRRRDGSIVRVHAIYRPVPAAGAGAPPDVLVTLEDVTQRRVRRDAETVGVSYGHLLDSTPDAILIVNQTGHVVLANRNANRLFGYPPHELIGQPIEVLLPSRFRGEHARHRGAYRLQPRVRAMGAGLELYGLRKDGSEFPVEISLSPLRVNDDALVMSAIRDMTERKRIQRELELKNAALAEASRTKDMFFASMSHELRTPLHGILGYTGTLLMRLPGPLNDEQVQQLTTVQTSARHLLALINGLLDIARIESGRVELELASLDVNHIADDVVTSLRPNAELKGLALRLKLAEVPARVDSDARSVRQILTNLVGNAIKFTPSGHVEVEVVRGSHEGRATVELHVRDSGPGIEPADRARIFEPFERAVSAAGPAVEGTGLGLHVSRRLAEQLQGELFLQDSTAPGSEFILRLNEGAMPCQTS